MEAFWIILIVAGVITLIIGTAFLTYNNRINKFRKNVKKGDTVIFMNKMERYKGKITCVFNNHVNIRHWSSDKVIRRKKNKIY